jgi:prepilin-type processing-associated H-X9-DG protein
MKVDQKSLPPWPGILPREARGFSLVELFVVIAMITILGATLLPAMGTAKSQTEGVTCMNNTRQLALAWIMYAADNNGNLCPNRDGGAVQGWQLVSSNWTTAVPFGTLSWVGGWEDFFANNPDNTNLNNLKFGAIGGNYTSKNTAIYHCPADRYLAKQGVEMLPRVRSKSMNAFVGLHFPADLTNGVNVWYPAYMQFTRSSQLESAGGSQIWLLADEHPDSIGDGWMIADMTDKARFEDLPASYHGGGCSFAYCDGHSEIHLWHGNTFQPVRMIQRNGFAGDPGDVAWLQHHSAVLK